MGAIDFTNKALEEAISYQPSAKPRYLPRQRPRRLCALTLKGILHTAIAIAETWDRS